MKHPIFKHAISSSYRFRFLSVLTLIAALWAVPPARADLVIGDLSNPFGSVYSLNPGSGVAQRFDVTAGFGPITLGRLYLGNQDPVYPVTPVVQIRDASGISGGPGAAVLGSFSVNALDIPLYVFGANNFAAVSANPLSSLSLGIGTYWLCIANSAAIGSFQGGFTSANPVVQNGANGNVINLAGISLSFDNGTSYGSPGLSGSALLMELQTIPEPSTTVLVPVSLAIAGYLARKRRGPPSPRS
jgi:hypothetical protein